MIKRLTAILVVGLLGYGCVSKEEQAVAQQIASLYHADVSTKKGYIKTSDKDKLSGKYLEVTINEPDSMTPESHGELQYPAAASAYYLSQAQPIKQGEYDFIRVVFEIGPEKTTYEYPVSDLLKYKVELSKVQDAIKKLAMDDYQPGLFDQRYISASDAGKIYSLIHAKDTASFELIGFMEGELKDEKALAVKYSLTDGQESKRIKITTIINKKQTPIVGFTMGE